jgi:hypothetical protein
VADGAVGVAWSDVLGKTGRDVFLQRFDGTGDPLDAAPRRVNTDDGDADQTQPALAAGAAGAVGLVWISEGRLQGTLSRDGGVNFLVPEIAISGADGKAADPTAAFDAAGLLHAAWSDAGADGARVLVNTLAVDGAGLAAGTPAPIGSGQEALLEQGRPSIGLDAAGAVLVAFHELTPGPWEDERYTLWLAKRPAGAAAFSHARVDDEPIPHCGKDAASLALDTAGRAFVLWTDGRYDAADGFFSRGE